MNTARIFLDIAFTIAVSEIDNKKLLDVQIARALLYLYQCDFENYSKHILSIGKGLPENMYSSLQNVYDTAVKLHNKDLQLKYVANLAFKSGHYYTALDLVNKMTSADKETSELANKSLEIINNMNGEFLLNNGYYISSLDLFEKENNEVEKGRAYLAISKSLLDSKETKHAEIAEKFGVSTLLNYISNDPNQPKANLYLALYFLDKGDKNQAKESIRRGLNAQDTDEVITAKLLNLADNL